MLKTAAVAVGICLLGPSITVADEINSFKMNAKASSEVERFKATNNARGVSAPSTGAPAVQSNCGASANIGNVSTNGGNAPREVNTIVTGDVIVVNNGNCH